MNKKEYEECLNRLNKYVFSRDMAVKGDWYYLLNYHKQQLQEYQEREQELRGYLKTRTVQSKEFFLSLIDNHNEGFINDCDYLNKEAKLYAYEKTILTKLLGILDGKDGSGE